MKLESEEYPFCQLNETINLSPDSKVLSKSLMINLRNSSPQVVYQNYLDLKRLINGNGIIGAKNAAGTQVKKDNGTCPQCGGILLEKAGISKKNGKPYRFISCSNFPSCKYSQPFSPEKERIMSYNEEVISVEDIPF